MSPEAYTELVKNLYRLHYKTAISPNLAVAQKQALAEKISALTLEVPIWADNETDWSSDFPELAPYVNVKLSGLYLCAILEAIVGELQAGPEDLSPDNPSGELTGTLLEAHNG